MLAKKFNIKQVTFVNIGGIINETTIWDDGFLDAVDVGPGMCLIDKWIRINSKKKYDDKGNIAKDGKINKIILNKALRNFSYTAGAISRKSFDTKDFEDFFNILHSSFFKGLSFKDAVATLTEFTVSILRDSLIFRGLPAHTRLILCGGGRKNNFLVKRMKQHLIPVEFIDDFGVDGDFVESQAFAHLAVRSYLKLPISFPETTGVRKPCTGGTIVKNF